jgi:putative ABC transport system substrate-binding protein
MRRRDLLTLLGGAAVAWPLAAQAQQTTMPVVGLLDPTSPDAYADLSRAVRQGLKETGYVEGENVAIVYRFADNQIDRLPELATELVRRQVAVIAATGGPPSVLASKAATTTIPIVFGVAQDPVALGLVASLGRPGGNLTGISFLNTELAAKRLEFMRELVPAATRVAVLVNPTSSANAATTLKELEAAAPTIGVHIQILNASTIQEIDAAFATLARDRLDALFVSPDPFFRSRRVHLALSAMRHAVPSTYALRDYAEAGGLMSYGASLTDAYRQVGIYAGRVLKGAKPADLPVVQSSKFELVINHQTARLLGLTVPPSLLATGRRGDRMRCRAPAHLGLQSGTYITTYWDHEYVIITILTA